MEVGHSCRQSGRDEWRRERAEDRKQWRKESGRRRGSEEEVERGKNCRESVMEAREREREANM